MTADASNPSFVAIVPLFLEGRSVSLETHFLPWPDFQYQVSSKLDPTTFEWKLSWASHFCPSVCSQHQLLLRYQVAGSTLKWNKLFQPIQSSQLIQGSLHHLYDDLCVVFYFFSALVETNCWAPGHNLLGSEHAEGCLPLSHQLQQYPRS